jgi:hypothetical protein
MLPTARCLGRGRGFNWVRPPPRVVAKAVVRAIDRAEERSAGAAAAAAKQSGPESGFGRWGDPLPRVGATVDEVQGGWATRETVRAEIEGKLWRLKNWDRMTAGRERKQGERIVRALNSKSFGGGLELWRKLEEVGFSKKAVARAVAIARARERREEMSEEMKELWRALEELGFSKERAVKARPARGDNEGMKVQFRDGLPTVGRKEKGGLLGAPLLGQVGAAIPGPKGEAEAESGAEGERYAGPLPFPFPMLHVGTDIVRVSRIEQILKDKLGRRFLRRLLTEEEALAMWMNKGDVTTMRREEWTAFWEETLKWNKAERIAGRSVLLSWLWSCGTQG